MTNKKMEVPRGLNYDIEADVPVEYLENMSVIDDEDSMYDRIPVFEEDFIKIKPRTGKKHVLDYQYRMIRNTDTGNLMFLRTPDSGESWEQCGKWAIEKHECGLPDGQTVVVDSVVPTEFKRIPDNSDFYYDLRNKEALGELQKYGKGNSYPSPIDMPKEDLKKLFQIARKRRRKIIDGKEVLLTTKFSDKHIDTLMNKYYSDREIRNAIKNEQSLEQQIYDNIMESNYVTPDIYKNKSHLAGQSKEHIKVNPDKWKMMDGDFDTNTAIPGTHENLKAEKSNIGRIKVFRPYGANIDADGNPLPGHITNINKLTDKDIFKIGDLELTVADSFIRNSNISPEMKAKLESHRGPGSWKSVLKDLPSGEYLCEEADALRSELKNAFMCYANRRYDILEQTNMSDEEAQKTAFSELQSSIAKVISHHKIFSGMLNGGTAEQRTAAAGVIMEAWTEAGSEFRSDIDERIRNLTPQALKKIAAAKAEQASVEGEAAYKEFYRFVQDEKTTFGLLLLAPYAPVLALMALAPLAIRMSAMSYNIYEESANLNKAEEQYKAIDERVSLMRDQFVGRYCVYDYITNALQGKEVTTSSYFERTQGIMKAMTESFDNNLSGFLKENYEKSSAKNGELIADMEEKLNKMLSETSSAVGLTNSTIFTFGASVLDNVKNQSNADKLFIGSMLTGLDVNSSAKSALEQMQRNAIELRNISDGDVTRAKEDQVAANFTNQVINYKKNLIEIDGIVPDNSGDTNSFKRAKDLVKNRDVLNRYVCDDMKEGYSETNHSGIAAGLTGMVAGMYVKQHVAEKAMQLFEDADKRPVYDTPDDFENAKANIRRYTYTDEKLKLLGEADMRLRCMAASKPHEFNETDYKKLIQKTYYVRYMKELMQNNYDMASIRPLISTDSNSWEDRISQEVYDNIQHEGILNRFSVKYKLDHTTSEISGLLDKCKGLSYTEFLNAKVNESQQGYVSIISDTMLENRLGKDNKGDSNSKTELSGLLKDMLYSLAMYESYESQVKAYCNDNKVQTVSGNILSGFAIEAADEIKKSYDKISNMGPLYASAACDVIEKLGMSEQFKNCTGTELNNIKEIHNLSSQHTDAMATKIIKVPDMMQGFLSETGQATMVKEYTPLLMAGIETAVGLEVTSLMKDNLISRDMQKKIFAQEMQTEHNTVLDAMNEAEM